MPEHSELPSSVFCPLCKKRLPTTKVEYDEVVAAQTTAIDNGMVAVGQPYTHDLKQVVMEIPPVEYSSRVTSTYGDVMVCEEASAWRM